jgi:DNA-binding NtrC family response regulator
MRIPTVSQWSDDIPDPIARLGIVGQSVAFHDCYRQIRRLARSKAPLLIEGETGTGKECAARCAHYLGPRQDQPFMPVNCGALPDSMFENELFGHAQGAYTDARTARDGLVARAGRGTLFLDEVDALTPKAQVALLRFLEDRTYRRLGDSAEQRADVAILAATNADLDRRAADGHFRQDLLFRLSTLRLRLPALRERRTDIALLARNHVYALSELYEAPLKQLAPGFVAWLEQQPWPGNIRELQNCLHRAFLLTDGDIIENDAPDRGPCIGFSLELRSLDAGYDGLKRAVMREFERQFLDRVMRDTGGNVTRAARLLGKDRRALGRLLVRNGIDRARYACGRMPAADALQAQSTAAESDDHDATSD